MAGMNAVLEDRLRRRGIVRGEVGEEAWATHLDDEGERMDEERMSARANDPERDTLTPSLFDGL